MRELFHSPWVRLLLVVATVCAALWGLSALAGVLTPFAIAFTLAYFLNPPVNAMERFFERDIARSRLRGRVDPRTVAVALLCLSVAVVFSIVVGLVLPAAWHQLSEAASKLPAYLQTLRDKLEPLYERLNLRYPAQAEELRRRLQTAARENALEMVKPATRAAGAAFSSLLGFVLSVLNLFVIPVFAAYLLYDMNRIHAGARELVPERYRPYVFARISEVDCQLSAFVRGQITVCLILGSFYALTLTLAGVPMGVVVGFVIGFFNLIPFMSHVVGLPIALLLSWVDDQSPQRLLGNDGRVQATVAALTSGDLAALGRLFAASHASLRDLFEVSCMELDTMVDIATAVPGVVASRMTGAGFGGCTVSLVMKGAEGALVERVLGDYPARTGITPEVYVVAATDGAGVVTEAIGQDR